MRHLLLATVALVATNAATNAALAATPATHDVALDAHRAAGQPTYGSFGFDTAGMDRAVTPGNDWARFANGTYEDKLVIPADKSTYGMFNVLRDLSQSRTRGLVEAAAANAVTAATALRTAAASGDAAATAQATRAMGGACGACHRNYRGR